MKQHFTGKCACGNLTTTRDLVCDRCRRIDSIREREQRIKTYTERGLAYADGALRCASLRRTAPVSEPYRIRIAPQIGRYLPFNLEPL